MPEFILDTSGHVREHLPDNGCLEWHNLDSFTQGYIEALFFTETEPSTARENHSAENAFEGRISQLPGDYGFADLAPQALATIIADCTRFQNDNGTLIDACAEFSENIRPDNDDVWTRAGRDYWFTRNGHGVGFWEDDRWPALEGTALDAGAKAAGGMDAYLGDDGRVYMT